MIVSSQITLFVENKFAFLASSLSEILISRDLFLQRLSHKQFFFVNGIHHFFLEQMLPELGLFSFNQISFDRKEEAKKEEEEKKNKEKNRKREEEKKKKATLTVFFFLKKKEGTLDLKLFDMSMEVHVNKRC